jgi:hypothetical protein
MQCEEICVVVQSLFDIERVLYTDGAYDTTAEDDDDADADLFVFANLFVSADILVDRNTLVFVKYLRQILRLDSVKPL